MALHKRDYIEPKAPKLTVHVGFIRDTRDFLRYGRIKVYIPDFRSPDEKKYWVIVQYASPFAGATNPDKNVAKEGNTNYEESQESYGWWAIPPDVNNEVLVVFANGEFNRGYFFAFPYQEDMNHGVPANASSADVDNEDKNARAPTVERNKKDIKSSVEGLRPIFKPFYDNLKKQGLIDDFERGPTDSSARRDIISQVFGYKSPRGHHIYIDDGELDSDKINEKIDVTELERYPRLPRKDSANEYIRMRTRLGAQLIINDTLGYFYFISKDGDTWVELSDYNGVDIYTKHNVNIRSQKDMNLRIDGDMNIEVGGNLTTRVVGNQKTTIVGNKESFIGGDLTELFSGETNLTYKKALKETVTDEYSLSVGAELIANSSGKLSLKSSNDLAIESSSEIGITAGGDIREQAANVYMNSGAGVSASNATTAIEATAIETQTRDDVDPNKQDTVELDTFLEQEGIVTHEPFLGHAKVGDDLTPLKSPITTTGTNGLVIQDDDVIVKDGAISNKDRLPASVKGTPKPGMLPGCYKGTGYDENENPIYDKNSDNVTTIDKSSASLSQKGLARLKAHEGKVVDPNDESKHVIYKDQAGLDTIGYGHLITASEKSSGRFSSGSITEAEAEALLSKDVTKCENTVKNSVTSDLTQDQFDSLVSFCFNVGEGAFKKSTLLRKLNSGDYAGATSEFGRWNKITDPKTGNKIESTGLTKRRRYEARVFAGKC